MLQWTCSASGLRFCLYVHHTDAEREWACDCKSSIGRLDKGLDEAAAKAWAVAGRVVDATPNVAGQVIAITSEKNVLIKAGSVLVQLDPELFRFKVRKLEAELAVSMWLLRVIDLKRFAV